MRNAELSRIFGEMADILEFLGGNVFRVRSYRRASQIVYGLPDDAGRLLESGELSHISGIGSGLLAHIREYVENGRIENHEEIRAQVPSGIIELMAVPGLGPATLRTLHDKLGITDSAGLVSACETHRIRELPGFGSKKEENILKNMERFRSSAGRFPLGQVYEDVRDLLGRIRKFRGVTRAEAAGSFRRMKETVGDVDVLATGGDSAGIIDQFSRLAEVKEVIVKGDTKCSVLLRNGMQADLRVVDDGSFGACLQYFTGSKNHNVRLRGIAKEKGYKLNEYGIFREDAPVPCPVEDDVYRTLGMPWIEPEMREDRGEIDLALDGRLPALIGYDQIRGDVHVHSAWSDGGESIRAMADAAIAAGYEYLVITDHSRSLKIAHGLELERVEEQLKEISALNRLLTPFRIFSGTECDIKRDGSLDYPDELLCRLDFVIASVHSGFRDDGKTMTGRIVRALENPWVTLLGHPTGRLINSREAYNADLIEVFNTAALTGTFLEINSYFERLDLNDVNARIAREHGCRFCIGTDAHNASQYRLIRYGIGQARRAWLTADDVVNTLPVAKFAKAIGLKRARHGAL